MHRYTVLPSIGPASAPSQLIEPLLPTLAGRLNSEPSSSASLRFCENSSKMSRSGTSAATSTSPVITDRHLLMLYVQPKTVKLIRESSPTLQVRITHQSVELLLNGEPTATALPSCDHTTFCCVANSNALIPIGHPVICRLQNTTSIAGTPSSPLVASPSPSYSGTPNPGSPTMSPLSPTPDFVEIRPIQNEGAEADSGAGPLRLKLIHRLALMDLSFDALLANIGSEGLDPSRVRSETKVIARYSPDGLALLPKFFQFVDLESYGTDAERAQVARRALEADRREHCLSVAKQRTFRLAVRTIPNSELTPSGATQSEVDITRRRRTASEALSATQPSLKRARVVADDDEDEEAEGQAEGVGDPTLAAFSRTHVETLRRQFWGCDRSEQQQILYGHLEKGLSMRVIRALYLLTKNRTAELCVDVQKTATPSGDDSSDDGESSELGNTTSAYPATTATPDVAIKWFKTKLKMFLSLDFLFHEGLDVEYFPAIPNAEECARLQNMALSAQQTLSALYAALQTFNQNLHFMETWIEEHEWETRGLTQLKSFVDSARPGFSTRGRVLMTLYSRMFERTKHLQRRLIEFAHLKACGLR